ncbi:MAG: hypothetical protein FJ150_04815 [Euryarchaeota archaeon]|nr:hypothetical protein [Euryarchaeota archaeon]
MDNIEIRRKILEKLYDTEKINPGNIISSIDLGNELNISNEDLGFNIKYLKEKQFINAEQMATPFYSALLSIAPYGIDIVEDENEFNRSFPLMNITNIRNSKGVVINSDNVKIDISENINIKDSFNEIYNEIDNHINAKEVEQRIKAIEEELSKDKISTSKIKESTNWLHKNANWTILPLIQIFLSLYGLTLPR